jgi:hypothetical protein
MIRDTRSPFLIADRLERNVEMTGHCPLIGLLVNVLITFDSDVDSDRSDET